jgi:hypothetical protein
MLVFTEPTRRGCPSGLDGVAGPGAGAVQFDVADAARVDAGAGVGGGQDLLLRGAVGDGQALAAAVVVDGAAGQDAVHRVAVGQRVGERLEDDEAAALAADVPVGAGVEGVAAAVGRQRPEPLHGEGAVLGEDEVDAAGQRDGALAAPQALGGQVHRHQRGGLAGVDGEARSAQAERVGDPVGDQAPAQTGGGLRGDGAGPGGPHQGGVVVGDGPDEDARGAPREPGGHQSGVLHGLPGQFEREPLLRVHGLRLARGDAEEGRVEPVDLGQEAAARRGVGALGGGRSHGLHAVAQQPAELLPARRARQPARQAHDRDRRRGTCLEVSGFCLGPSRHQLPLPHSDRAQRAYLTRIALGARSKRRGGRSPP